MGNTFRGKLAHLRESISEILENRGGIPFPPRRMREHVGRFKSLRTYRLAGEAFLGYLKELCALQPGHRVLDIGCGCGQSAVALTEFLNAEGSYLGFDIAEDLIRWCERHITSRFPAFRFEHADLYNKRYNTKTTARAADYVFPVDDGAIDVTFAKSVFTHLLQADTEQYLSEVARVLAPGGHGLLTFFLINEDSRAGLAAGHSVLPFAEQPDGTWIADPAIPELAVAYPERAVRAMLDERGLRIVEPIRFGSWCGRSDVYRESYQDLVIVAK